MLTPKTLHLIKVINGIPFVEAFLEKHNKKFSKKTETFLGGLVDKMKEAVAKWNTQKGKIMQSRIIRGHIPKSTSYQYMPKEICNIIDESSVLQNSYTLEFPSRKITVEIVLNNTRRSEVRIRSILFKVFLWFYVVDPYTSPDCSSHIHLYLYLTDHKKTLPTQTLTAVSQQHVNTAFTTGCQKKTEIHVYRQEEWFKVLIHESFHTLGLDFLAMDPTILQEGNRQLQTLFHVQIPDIRFYESYCEMSAEILNALFYCYMTNTQKKNDAIIQNLHTCLTYESIFSLMQCVKILNHHGFVYDDFFKNPEKWRSYTESTQVFSYYVIKCIYMVHFTEFLELVSTWGTLKFPRNKKDFTVYLNLLREKMKSNKMRTGMNNMEYWIVKQHAITPYRKPYELCTLRMSLLEFY